MLENRILRGLAMEWALAESFLPRSHRGRMRLPGFELRDMERTWGSWQRDKKNIALSRRLVHEYAWKSVREVLLHEMAHQMTDEVLGGVTETPHGPRFREACKILNADPSASGSFPSIYERMENDELEANDRAMLRVKKLLAMAQSSNKNEAEVAMAKAYACIAKYNIDIRSEEKSRTYCSMCVGEAATRQSADKYTMAALLRDYYFVQTVWVPMFVVADVKKGRILELSGSIENARMADYVHAFLSRAIDEQWELYQARRWTSKPRKTDFALGLVAGFREKLDAQKKAMKSCQRHSFALVKADDVLLKAYMNERYPRLRRMSQRGRSIDKTVHNAGREAGRAAILSKPIESGPTGAVRLLMA